VDFGYEDRAPPEGVRIDFKPTYEFFGFKPSGNSFSDIVEFGRKAISMTPTDLARRYRKYLFESYDYDGNGTIDINELKALLLDIAGAMDKPALRTVANDLDKLKKALTRIDSDKNEKIDFSEFEALLNTLSGFIDDATQGSAAAPEGGPAQKLRDIFTPVLQFYGLKSTGNAFKDIITFPARVSEVHESFLEKQFMKSVFADYDKNADYSLDFEEFVKFTTDVVDTLNLKGSLDLTDSNLKQAFSDVDKDGNGKITFEEFLYWLEVCKLKAE